MKKEDLRVSTNLTELTSIVGHIMAKKTGFTLWQNKKNNKKVIPGAIQGHDYINGKLTITFATESTRLIDSSQRIFIFSKELQLLFKGRVRIANTRLLKILVDKKFYQKEKREIFRFDLFKKNLKLEIDRKLELKNKFKNESVLAKDLSDNGCGFFVTPNRAILFQVNSTIVLNALDGFKFDRPIKAIVRHISPVEVEHEMVTKKLMLIGVEFEEAYPNIDAIIQKVEFKTSF